MLSGYRSKQSLHRCCGVWRCIDKVSMLFQLRQCSPQLVVTNSTMRCIWAARHGQPRACQRVCCCSHFLRMQQDGARPTAGAHAPGRGGTHQCLGPLDAWHPEHRPLPSQHRVSLRARGHKAPRFCASTAHALSTCAATHRLRKTAGREGSPAKAARIRFEKPAVRSIARLKQLFYQSRCQECDTVRCCRCCCCRWYKF